MVMKKRTKKRAVRKAPRKQKQSVQRKIPVLDLVTQYRGMRTEIDRAIGEVVQSGRFIMGPQVAALEETMASLCATTYAVGCASGTDALQMALMAAGVGPGDEVITTPFTFIATAEVIVLLGATPVFVDIDPVIYNIRPDAIEAAVTPKTKAVIPVHLYGQAADMDPILATAKRHGLFVIEDAAQAVGALYKTRPVCSLGDVGCLSFFPSKNLGAYGDGGMLLTSDEGLARKLRVIRDHGSDRKYHHVAIGVNSRLDTLQAAVLLVKAKRLSAWNEARRDRAALYSELLKNAKVTLPVTIESNRHVFNQYSIQADDRNGLQQHLEAAGIATAVHYPIPLHLQPAFEYLGLKPGCFPTAETVAGRILSLPMHPELSEEEIVFIARTIVEFTG